MQSYKRLLHLLVILFLGFQSMAQGYHEQILVHREKYMEELLKDEHSPLGKKDLKHLRFFNPDSTFIVKASFTRIKDTIGFDMQTHNGVLKKYFTYGKVDFMLNNTKQKLFVYQSQKLLSKEGFEDYLFIPFTDETNYSETFGGGRYLDFKIGDIKEGSLEIDFNKCYNPYCAYKEGYACPIPPSDNKLSIAIKAGEKLFAKKKTH
jgi:uncharacterized protein (DUF1684 family)